MPELDAFALYLIRQHNDHGIAADKAFLEKSLSTEARHGGAQDALIDALAKYLDTDHGTATELALTTHLEDA